MPRGSSYSPEVIARAIAVLDGILAQRKALKPFEGRCLRAAVVMRLQDGA